MLDSGANLLHDMDLNIDVIIKKYIYGAQNNKTYIFFFNFYFLVQQQTIMQIFVIQHVT